MSKRGRSRVSIERRLVRSGRFVFLGSRRGPSISEEFGLARDATYGKEEISTHRQQDREIRAARTQALFRAVNEQIRAVNESFAVLTGTFTVACECADSGCLEMLEISTDAYERVREGPYTFVVLADHVDLAVEQVVAKADGHVVVEMPGEDARRILDETAPVSPAAHGEGF